MMLRITHWRDGSRIVEVFNTSREALARVKEIEDYILEEYVLGLGWVVA